VTRRIVIGSVILAAGLILLGLGLFGRGQGTAAVVTELAVGAILTFIGVALLSVLFAGPFVNFIGQSRMLALSLLALGIALPALIFTIGDGVPDSITGWIGFVLKIFVSVVAVITGASILMSTVQGRPLGIGGSAAGLEGRLARQNAARTPQRTAATATALTIGIALVSTVGVVGESLKASFAETLDRSVQADLFIYDRDTNGAFSGELADRLDGIDGLSAVSRFRVNEIRVDEDIEDVAAYNSETGEALIAFDLSSGSTEGLADGGILVFADAATERSLSVGDAITVEFPDLETEELTVAGIFEDNSVLNSPWIIDLGVYEEHVGDDDDIFVGATIAESADAAAVKAEVVAVADEFSSVTAQDTQEFLDSQEGQVDQLITLINYLLAFALVVAFLGVINTIVLSVIERTREIGLLRAIGMTRTQVRSTIRWEAVIVCLFGAVLGIVLGVRFAWAAVSAIPDDIIGTVAIPYESVLFAILVAALAGVIAALLPARRAARLNVLDAIATGG
jgi:putative ABC transport system permease protein